MRLGANLWRRAMSSDHLLDKFQGAMVGAVLGDALGAPLEFISDKRLSSKVILNQFKKYRDQNHVWKYTDDTAMAIQLADSLAAKQAFDEADLARRFSEEYIREPYRGYGKAVVDVFFKLRDSDYKDVWSPAKEQFDGSGSLGNGGAMRVHPVSLFALNKGIDAVKKLARKTAQITHAHKQGTDGAVLQAVAVYLALLDTTGDKFLDTLRDVAREFNETETDEYSFAKSIDLIDGCIKSQDDQGAYNLGNDVIAVRSVPSSIFSFLRILKKSENQIKGIDNGECDFIKVIQLAYTFGGDTDTIGSMAGAIAGAYWGISNIPQKYLLICEGVQKAISLANLLYKASKCENLPTS